MPTQCPSFCKMVAETLATNIAIIVSCQKLSTPLRDGFAFPDSDLFGHGVVGPQGELGFGRSWRSFDRHGLSLKACAAEQDRSDVAAARAERSQHQAELDPERPVFTEAARSAAVRRMADRQIPARSLKNAYFRNSVYAPQRHNRRKPR